MINERINSMEELNIEHDAIDDYYECIDIHLRKEEE